jgi:hypothetical protein
MSLVDVVGQDEGARLYGDLRRVAEVDDHVGVRVDAVIAVAAAEQGLREDLILGDAGAWIELLLEGALASGAAELAIEGLPDFAGGGELIFVTLDGPQDELGIHFGDGH